MQVRRPLAVLCVIAPLAIGTAACSDSSGGTVTGTRGLTVVRQISNPVQNNCEHFGPIGVTRVQNNTGVDIILHKNPDCTDPPGQTSFYLPATESANVVIRQGLWKSFAPTGFPPPVPVN
ncbi:hypothetical protein [Actinacidiphila acidipaludis]|uniref:Lipoprotein n=1 Tax=Actinacidiphila acidipaludis TaxID=2873382 RepID=A0ABS7Q9P7_9ACTN|nr:hypothetical protein [Streptomyces acidipaludis]MBY8879165.1 hypothetical protein [Streptomyces acidipaludis]